MKNPFIFGKVVTGEAFVDREDEQKILITNFENGINTIIISPRRWGKTSLVFQAATKFQKKNKSHCFCFLDLFNIRNEEEFYNYFAREVLKVSYSKWEERLEAAKKFFKKIIPKFSIGLDPNHDFSISFDWEDVKKNPEEILNLPELIAKKKKINFIICVDEFQNISFFDDPLSFQKKLRANWQHHQFVTYCLYGSKRHMLTEIFENKSMPFYKFGQLILLEKIPEKYWIEYIIKRFTLTNKIISEKEALLITQKMENHPYFVQQLAYTTWNLTKKECSENNVEMAIEELLIQNSILYQREIDNLTNSQINFLKALCDNVKQLSSIETIKKYNLGTSANVNLIKNTLYKREIIDFTYNTVEFIDPLFKIWFQRVFLNKNFN